MPRYTKMHVFYCVAVFVLVLVDLFRGVVLFFGAAALVVVFLEGTFFVVVVLAVVLAATFCVLFLSVDLRGEGATTAGDTSSIEASAMISSTIGCKLSVVVVSVTDCSVVSDIVGFSIFMRGWLSCFLANFLL